MVQHSQNGMPCKLQLDPWYPVIPVELDLVGLALKELDYIVSMAPRELSAGQLKYPSKSTSTHLVLNLCHILSTFGVD